MKKTMIEYTFAKTARNRKKDERNIAIATKSKAKAYDQMTFLFGVLMLSFALMNIDMVAILLLVAAYLSVHIYGIYYRIKYDMALLPYSIRIDIIEKYITYLSNSIIFSTS